ncbi:MAG: hypothetical protein NVV83_00020 [Afipia sp.]|nr:hypothetical protein [Afipia sp.]
MLAVFAIAGLVASPLVTPVAAKPLSAAVMSDMSAMSADMPCCPETQKSNDCQDCPFRVTCALGVAQAQPPVATGILAPLPVHCPLTAFDDRIADGLDGSPPDHPPRNLV